MSPLLPVALALVLAAPIPLHAEETAAAAPDRVAASRAAVKAIGDGLKEQLSAALKSGGPVAALSVCNTIAPALTKEKSDALGLTVGRTALKVRNPANAPDAFERKVLEKFVKEIAAGADPSTLEHTETVSENGQPVFRYMKAIPTAAEPCLVCHGSDLKPDVKAEIDRLYPEDQAIGFKAGELRGAFTVRQQAP